MFNTRIITCALTIAGALFIGSQAMAQGIPALSTEVQSVQSSVDALQASVNALRSQTAGISGIASAIQALQASVNGLQTSVNALQTASNNAGGGAVNARYTPPISDFAATGVTVNILNAAAVTRTIRAELLMAGATAVLFDNQQMGPGLTAVTSGPLSQIFFGRGFNAPEGAVLRVTVLDAGGSRSDIRAAIQVLKSDGTSGPALAAE
jgi:outer membrane murein-binding lipoprotein Lpp